MYNDEYDDTFRKPFSALNKPNAPLQYVSLRNSRVNSDSIPLSAMGNPSILTQFLSGLELE